MAASAGVATTAAREGPLGAIRRYRQAIWRAGLSAGIAVAALLVVIALGVYGLYDLAYALRILPTLTRGFVATLGLIVIVIPFGFLLGFSFGWGRTVHSSVVRWISTTYVEFFRSMPPVVLIVFSYLITLVVLAGNNRVDPTAVAPAVAVLALAAHSGAYQAEIVRAGVLSVPAGQREAAEALGMSRLGVMFNVTLPQMFRISLPALGNEFASVIKDTSILATVSVLELTFQGVNLVSRLFQAGGNPDFLFIVWVEVAILYFVLTFAVSRTLLALEKRYRVPGLEAPQL